MISLKIPILANHVTSGHQSVKVERRWGRRAPSAWRFSIGEAGPLGLLLLATRLIQCVLICHNWIN